MGIMDNFTSIGGGTANPPGGGEPPDWETASALKCRNYLANLVISDPTIADAVSSVAGERAVPPWDQKYEARYRDHFAGHFDAFACGPEAIIKKRIGGYLPLVHNESQSEEAQKRVVESKPELIPNNAYRDGIYPWTIGAGLGVGFWGGLSVAMTATSAAVLYKILETYEVIAGESANLLIGSSSAIAITAGLKYLHGHLAPAPNLQRKLTSGLIAIAIVAGLTSLISLVLTKGGMVGGGAMASWDELSAPSSSNVGMLGKIQTISQLVTDLSVSAIAFIQAVKIWQQHGHGGHAEQWLPNLERQSAEHVLGEIRRRKGELIAEQSELEEVVKSIASSREKCITNALLKAQDIHRKRTYTNLR